MGGQHLSVVHDFTLVGRDLQRGQHIIHTRQAGGGAGWGAVETPLEDVEARPACYMGALFLTEEICRISLSTDCFEDKQFA